MFALAHCVCIIQHLHPSLYHSFDATTLLHHKEETLNVWKPFPREPLELYMDSPPPTTPPTALICVLAIESAVVKEAKLFKIVQSRGAGNTRPDICAHAHKHTHKSRNPLSANKNELLLAQRQADKLPMIS